VNGLLVLGADEPPRENNSLKLAAGLLGGVLLGALWGKHRALGVLNGFALGNNLSRIWLREISLRRGVENVGAHLVATAGSLALPSHPVIGYLAGALGGSMFIHRDDTLLERVEETVVGKRRNA